MPTVLERRAAMMLVQYQGAVETMRLANAPDKFLAPEHGGG